MNDEPPDIVCEDCDARFYVVFHNWYGKKPIEFCPFCGSEDLTKESEGTPGGQDS